MTAKSHDLATGKVYSYIRSICLFFCLPADFRLLENIYMYIISGCKSPVLDLRFLCFDFTVCILYYYWIFFNNCSISLFPFPCSRPSYVSYFIISIKLKLLLWLLFNLSIFLFLSVQEPTRKHIEKENKADKVSPQPTHNFITIDIALGRLRLLWMSYIVNYLDIIHSSDAELWNIIFKIHRSIFQV